MRYSAADRNNWKRHQKKRVNKYVSTFENDMNVVKNLVTMIRTNPVKSMLPVYIKSLHAFACAAVS